MKMKKNILSIVISILSACILCVNLSVTATAGYTSDYVYNILETTAEKEFYNSLYQSCKEVDESDEYYTQTPYVENNYNLSHEHVLEIIHMFTYDHPEFFWLSNSTMFSSWYGYSLLILEDFYDGSDRQNAKNEIFAEIQTYIDGAKQCSTDYDKVKFFHDKLLQNVSYQEGDWDQTVASVFLQNATVCAGYSKAFALLCNAVGIDAISVTSCGHAWNVVKLDGFWFLIDVTNDYSSYKFFLISDSDMRNLDIQSGMIYQVTQTVNGVSQTYEFYVHDIDYLTYINYYDDFPNCSFSYDDLENYEPTNIAGDADSDGRVTVRDCAYIAMMLSKNSAVFLPSYADFNGDGKVSIRDASAIAAALVNGKI